MQFARFLSGIALLLASLPVEANSEPAEPRSRLAVETDAAGNLVRTRSGKTLLVPRKNAPEIHAASSPPTTTRGVLHTAVAAQASQAPPALGLDRVWSYSLWGTSLGRTGLEPVDLDGDGKLEIVMGTSISGGFSANSAWHVLRHDPATGSYEIAWSSGPVEGGVDRVAVLTAGGRPRIFVGRGDGVLMVHDGTTRALEASIAIASAPIRDILLADADNDGQEELLVLTPSTLHLLDPITYVQESELAYGSNQAAVGNVDADPELEIVLVGGPVLEYEGGTAKLEWDFSSFNAGRYLGLADLDGDGMEEIVAAQGWYYIDVYDADLQSPKLQIRSDLDIQALLLADVTGDGKKEILYGDGQWGEIHALDAASGTELWRIPNPEHGTTRIAVADTDDDGSLEVMWGAGWTSTGPDFFFVHGVDSKALEFQSFDLVGPFAAVAMGDTDDDGTDEIVAISWESDSGYADGVVHVFDAETFQLEWRSGTRLFGGHAWTGVHDVSIGDVDGDGASEIVIGTDRLYDGTIYVIDGKSHEVEAQYLYDSGSPIYAITLGDFDGDGRLEILAGNGRAHTGSPGTFLYVLDGASGAVEWKSVSLVSGWGGIYAIELRDLDGDGSQDAILSLGSVYVIDGATRSLRKSARTDFLGLDVADFDGNGTPEIWAGSQTGELVRLDPLTLAASTVATVCSGPVNSVRLDRASTLAGSIQFSCDDSLGIWGAFEGELLWRSAGLGDRVAYLNNLLVADRGEQALLVAGNRQGVVAYQGFGTANTDVDEDGVLNHLDNCAETANPDQADADADGVGDACNDAFDSDGDEWADLLDNCAETANPGQADADENGVGDACNEGEDADGDEWAELLDNCPGLSNPDQADRDGDGAGDVCDAYPDNPDNYAARCEEAVANETLYLGLFQMCSEELGVCESYARFSDADGDGEDDRSDRCPDTPAGQRVDAAGCSQAQFCASIDVSGPGGVARCLHADWQNDEPMAGMAGDCSPAGKHGNPHVRMTLPGCTAR